MTRGRRARLAVCCGILPLLLACACGGWTWYQIHRYNLNRALIDALVRHDAKQARDLVAQGADPNTRYQPTPAPTVKTLWDRLLHRAPTPVNTSPTALLIACGAPWVDDDRSGYFQLDYGADWQLVVAMLKRDARVNESAGHGFTPLLLACRTGDEGMVRVLLEHGADVNARDDSATTPLWFAVYYDAGTAVVRRLLEHGADPNLTIDDGDTALSCANRKNSKAVAALLVAHGARPRNPDPPAHVPAIARMLGVKVGLNGQDALTRRFGDGLHTTGGHPGGCVHWRTRNPAGEIETDGFNYIHEEGLALESLSWSLGTSHGGTAPVARRLPPHAGWLGLITPGMTSVQVSQLTAGRLPLPAISGSTWTWKARGFVRPSPNNYDVYTNWTASLTFQKSRLVLIDLQCEGGSSAP